MMMDLKVDKGIAAKVVDKAKQLIQNMIDGIKVIYQTIKLRGTQYKSVAVNRRYRLLLKNGVWHLMSHEKYNKVKGI